MTLWIVSYMEWSFIFLTLIMRVCRKLLHLSPHGMNWSQTHLHPSSPSRTSSRAHDDLLMYLSFLSPLSSSDNFDMRCQDCCVGLECGWVLNLLTDTTRYIHVEWVVFFFSCGPCIHVLAQSVFGFGGGGGGGGREGGFCLLIIIFTNVGVQVTGIYKYYKTVLIYSCRHAWSICMHTDICPHDRWLHTSQQLMNESRSAPIISCS